MPNALQERMLKATEKALEDADARGAAPKDPRKNNPNFDQWVEGMESGQIVQQLTAPSGPSGPSAAAKSLAHQIANSDLANYKKGQGQSAEIVIKAPNMRGALANGSGQLVKAPSFTPIADLRGHYSVEYDSEITPVGRRHEHMTDLVPVRLTENGEFQFIRETGYTSGTGTRPENVDPATAVSSSGSSTTIESVSRTLRRFDTYVAVPIETMEDLAEFENFLEETLDYNMHVERDSQIYAGSGTGNNMHGFTSDAAILTRNWSAGSTGDNRADAFLRAMGDLWVAGYGASGILIHDTDWIDIAMMKDSNGNYLIPQAHIQNNAFSLWGVPMTKSVIPTAGVSLVGAFDRAATYRQRYGFRVRMTDSHEGHFLTGIVFVLIESRGALGIKRPESFKFVNLDSAPA